MKLNADPMPALRQAKKDRVNASFNVEASASAHLDHAYSQKKCWAAVKDDRLKQEADARGLTVDQLSEIILSKPDLLAEREARRQAIMRRIDAAILPSDLNSLTQV